MIQVGLKDKNAETTRKKEAMEVVFQFTARKCETEKGERWDHRNKC